MKYPEPDTADESPAGDGDLSVTASGLGGRDLSGPCDVQHGDVLAGRYQIEAEIGRGGSGHVFRAWDRVVESAIALKLLDAALARDPVWIERVGRELKIARRIQHPNLCRVHEVGRTDDGRHFLTMELAAGGSLRECLNNRARPLGERLQDARSCIAGLAALHEAQIVHRDVKPENLLRMDDGRLVLSDFGLATLSPSTATRGVGTPSYMAPELAMGMPAGFRSDVWAVGVVLHEIVFGCRPAWKPTALGRELVSPANARAGRVERTVFRVVAVCLEENPARRPAHAGDVLRLFGRAERGRAMPLWGTVRPRQLGWGLVAALVAGGLFYTYQKRALWSPARADEARPVATVSGKPADWSTSAQVVATREGRVHCLSTLPDGRLRAIWGMPKVAEDIDLATRVATPAPLRRETFQDGCPRLSPDGRRLLFVRGEGAAPLQIMHSALPDGSAAAPVVAGWDPLWLPNGEEFTFRIDPSHAAVFALPVMRMQLLDDRLNGALITTDAAVDRAGSNLALMFTSLGRVDLTSIVFWELPSQRPSTSFDLPFLAWRPLFTRRGDLLFWAHEQDHDLLVRLDWRSKQAVRVGTIPGADLAHMALVGGGDRLAFVTQTLASDIIRVRPGRSDEPLTFDGRSYSPNLGAHGDLLLQQRDELSHSVIAYQPAPGQPTRALTSGPMDVTPSFLPDGRRWVYSAFAGAVPTIMLCDLISQACRPLHQDDGIAAWPKVSPNGETLAYIAAVQNARLRVVPMGGGSIRDLGPARAECPIYWSSPTKLWAMQGPDSGREWVEFDLGTGLTTERRSPAPKATELDPGCQPPLASGVAETVREARRYRSGIRVVDAGT